jgi:hypothetical protein
MELRVDKMKSWRNDIQSLHHMRFTVVWLCKFISHFVNIDPRVLYVFMNEISPELDVSNKEVTGEIRDTYWKNNFDFNRPKRGKKNVFTGTFGYDGVYLCVHYQRLRVLRPIPSSVMRFPKHEHKKTGDGTYNPLGNQFRVGLKLSNTNIITFAVPKRAEDGIDGNLREKDTRLL